MKISFDIRCQCGVNLGVAELDETDTNAGGYVFEGDCPDCGGIIKQEFIVRRDNIDMKTAVGIGKIRQWGEDKHTKMLMKVSKEQERKQDEAVKEYGKALRKMTKSEKKK